MTTRFAPFVAVAAIAVAAADASELTEMIRDCRHQATLAQDGLSGPGSRFILQRAAEADFTVVGESHGTRQTCEFTTWLLSHLHDSGYRAYVTETGACSTALAVAAAEQSGAEGIVRLVRAAPFSIAFLHLREEADVLAAAVKRGYKCWGIDQEFTGAPRLLLSHMASQAKGDDARKAASAALDRAKAGFEHFIKTGSQSRAFMGTASPADWKALEAAFANEDAALLAMIEELRASQRIYGLYHAGRYDDNNAERIKLMKQHLAENLRSAPATRAVIKIGSAHAGRGYSPFNQLDIGDYVAKLAESRGRQSLHICVLARRSIDENGRVTEHGGEDGLIREFLPAVSGDAASVFDLTALRPALANPTAKRAHPHLYDLTTRFDLLVLLPEFNPSEPVIPLPPSASNPSGPK